MMFTDGRLDGGAITATEGVIDVRLSRLRGV